MKPAQLKPLIKASLLAISLSATVLSTPALSQTNSKIEKYELKEKHAERELDFTKEKLSEARRKLKSAEKELTAQKKQVKAMQQQAQNNPSNTTLELLKNEQQRLAVAELSIKSQVSSYERLKRKQGELQKEIKASRKAVVDLKAAHKKAQASAKREAAQKAKKSADTIRYFAKENRELKSALASEQRRLANAELRIEELVKSIDGYQAQIEILKAEIAALSTPPPVPAEALLEPQAQTQVESETENPTMDLSTVVLDGETPIYQGEDGERIIVRSHSIDKKVVMTQIGEHLYQADIKVDGGRAYFDLRRKRYRGTFPKGFNGEYRFIYDLSNQDKPVLSVQHAPSDTQMVSMPGNDF